MKIYYKLEWNDFIRKKLIVSFGREASTDKPNYEFFFITADLIKNLLNTYNDRNIWKPKK